MVLCRQEGASADLFSYTCQWASHQPALWLPGTLFPSCVGEGQWKGVTIKVEGIGHHERKKKNSLGQADMV